MAKTRAGANANAPKAAKPADNAKNIKRGYEEIGISPPITMLAHKIDPKKGYAHVLTPNDGECDLSHSVNATSRLPYSYKPDHAASEDPAVVALLFALRKRTAAMAKNRDDLAGKLGKALIHRK